MADFWGIIGVAFPLVMYTPYGVFMQNREYLGKFGSIKVYNCIFLYPKFAPSISPKHKYINKEYI